MNIEQIEIIRIIIFAMMCFSALVCLDFNNKWYMKVLNYEKPELIEHDLNQMWNFTIITIALLFIFILTLIYQELM